MAQLLHIAPQQVQVDSRVPQPGHNFGQYLGKGLSDAADVFGKIQAGRDVAETARLAGEASANFEAGLQDSATKYSDPDEFKSNALETMKRTHETSLSSASSNRVKADLGSRLGDNLIRANTAIEKIYWTKNKDKAMGDYDLSERQMIDAIGRIEDPDERKALAEGFGILTGRMTGLGFLSHEKATERLTEFNKKSDSGRAGYLLETNPERLKAMLNDRNFPGLTSEQRFAWDQRANETIRERQLTIDKAKKEQVDRINNETLIASETQYSDLTGLRQSVLSRNDMPFETKKFWVDRLNKMIDEKLHPKHVVDPFKTSDSRTLASVMRGVLSDERDGKGQPLWTEDKILALMGNGLSVPHALQATNMLRRAEKDPAGTLTPLKMAQQTWSQLQSQLAFVPADERARNVPETLVKNNREAQRIWDEVVRREALKQDPRVALDELMQPHYDSTIKAWYDPRSYFSTSMTREEEVEARQLLTRRRQPVTEANIDATVKAIRENKNAAPQGHTPVPLAPGVEKKQLKQLRDATERINRLQRELLELKSKKR